jgi:hypothetical protein
LAVGNRNEALKVLRFLVLLLLVEFRAYRLGIFCLPNHYKNFGEELSHRKHQLNNNINKKALLFIAESGKTSKEKCLVYFWQES